MSKGIVVALGTMTGLVIGAISGILLAPEKGSKTRKQIKDKSIDYVDDLKSKIDEIRDLLAAKLESTSNDAGSLVEKAKAKYDEAKKDAKVAASDAKQKVS